MKLVNWSLVKYNGSITNLHVSTPYYLVNSSSAKVTAKQAIKAVSVEKSSVLTISSKENKRLRM